MLRTTGIAHFTLAVSDLERSARFYAEVLGLELLQSTGDMAFFRSGKDHLILVRGVVPGEPAATPAHSRLVHQAFIVEARDFEASVADLRGSGVEVFYEDERTGRAVFAGRSAYFYDPDHNVLEIIDLAATAYRPLPGALATSP